MNHITNLGDTINADWFNDEELSDTLFKAQIEDLIHTWVEYSHDSLNFSYGIIFSIICRIDIPQVNGVLLPTDSLDYTTNQLKDSGGGGTGGCKCNTSDDWCDLVGDFGECRSILQSCKPTRWGCGTLWLDPCNGMCVLTGPGGIE